MKNRIQLQDYQMTELLTENSFFFLFKGYSLVDKKQVIIQALKTENPSEEEITSAVHHYYVTRNIAVQEVLSPLKLIKHFSKTFIVMEYFQGITLHHYLESNKLTILDFLLIAEKLATALAKIHQHHIIHKNINPENILINKQTNEIKIIGFNDATFLKKEEQLKETLKEIDGNLAYISPEQTGKMNRSLDFRSDLYSLGATLYEMSTQRKVFPYNEPMELVHAHLAKTPVSPNELKDDLPVMISNIVMKLLQKSPENRYNSAFGLKEDLKKCIDSFFAFNKIEPFLLAQKDFASFFEPGRKLYGREEEIKEIKEAFERTSTGVTELLLISGEAGIGKTALVNEVHQPLINGKGYFISGKFDQLQRSIPYAPIIQSFQSLIRQIMAESAEKIKRWRGLLVEELGENLSIIISVIPELKWLLDEKTEQIEKTLAHHSQKSFLFYFRKFISVFARSEHPLVLFLDDLQWADIATLDLIEYILTYSEDSSLLIIAAFRHNEVHTHEPFAKMIKKLKVENIKITEIHLKQLPIFTINYWIEDVLAGRGEKEITELGQFMYRVSQGNPFHMSQLLQSFYDDYYIYFNMKSGRWEFQLESIKNNFVNENLLSFIIERISLLEEETQAILKIASCIGNEFELEILASVLKKTFVQVSDELWPALESGLIIPKDKKYKWVYPMLEIETASVISPSYRFLHDKVQQAVYSMVTEEERESIHLLLGRYLIKLDKTIVDEQLFKIVAHFNYSYKLLNDDEKIRLVEWNMKAGEKAKSSAAFKEALKFFKTGYQLLMNPWESDYELTYELMKELGESFYLNSEFEKSEQVFNEIIQNAKTDYEKLIIYELKTTLYTHLNRVEEAVETGIEGLRLLGFYFKRNPNNIEILKELLLVKKMLFRKKTSELINLPNMEDKEKILILQTLVTLVGPTILIDQNLATIFIFRALRYTLKHGITDISSLAISNYALILSAGFKDYKGSNKFGESALEIAEKSGQFALQGRINFIFGTFINHWKHSLTRNIQYLEISQRYSFNSGDIHLAGATSSFIVITLLIKGETLEEVGKTLDEQLRMAKEIDFPISSTYLSEIRKWLCFLLDGKEAVSWEFHNDVDGDQQKIMHYTVRLMMSYLYNEEAYAKEILQQLNKVITKRYTLVIVPEYYFYESLWQLRFYNKNGKKKQASLHKLKKNSKQLLKWAKISPHNYLHKYILIKAEMARLSNNDKAALNYYDKAVTLAEENGFIQDKAVAAECAASYFLEKGYTRLVTLYMTEAYESYIQWGAKSKAEKLYMQYKKFIDVNKQQLKNNLEKTFDINAALRATQLISKEIILEKLLKQLMEIIIQYAGAEDGVLLIKRGDQLNVVAKYDVHGNIHILQADQSFQNVKICEKIINYVQISKEALVLDDASESTMFRTDPYVSQYKPKSVLCIPILNQDDVKGILYVENNKVTKAFTKEIIDLLSFVCIQASISIENAHLYENLEENVKERTAELEVLNRNLEELNTKLAHSEQTRSRLLANISHDLRAPISAIQGYIEAVLDGVAETEELKERFLEKTLEQVQSLNGMINDLFDLARLESGQAQLELDTIRIDKLLLYIKEQFEHEIEKEGLRFELNMGMGKGQEYPVAEVDVRKMKQVFTNILINSKRHTASGGIFISLVSSHDEESVEITITDSGTGIASQYLPFIFDRNFTMDSKGNGLGLAICKEIITMHNGEIWAESVEGEGTAIIIRLPVYAVTHI
ncbi:ATP-binding sensor histidine kinase [Metabacillus fastidiosus]|uniref:ATP-binding sensor histidine kinase n=1 Tax=Metabacillus fastidiosus TaxID=1458 RepID=UPI002E1AD0A3|nr:trifunctional serine/threonine-protein kinase/ATP-binding protein/sensor histidine kinase [Metabacillus fastidiosus]